MKTELLLLANEKYRNFQGKLFKTQYDYLGVPLPILKKFYKEKLQNDPSPLFTNSSFEEILLKAYWTLDQKEDFNQKVKHIEDFLPLLDNWALCDSFVSYSKWIKKEKEYYKPYLYHYLKSDHEYTVRYGLVVFINYYMEDIYLDELFSIIKDLKREEYYIQMAIAWLLSYCFVIGFNQTYQFAQTLNKHSFIFKKGIQKALESHRIPKEDKDKLRLLKG